MPPDSPSVCNAHCHPGRRTLIVTRPAHEAAAWVQAVQAAGWPAEALALIEITSALDPLARHQARLQAAGCDALMFVSAQAVRHFCSPDGAPITARCWAPGPGTAAALQAAGIAPEQIDQPPADAAQFDSEALWAVVQPQLHPGHRLLVVRGQSADGRMGRDWLEQQCRARGVQVHSCVAYRRRAPQWDAGTAERVREWVRNGAVWLFSSSEAIKHLQQLLPDGSWAQAVALVSHPRIAASAKRLGFGEIMAHRPTIDDLLRALSELPAP